MVAASFAIANIIGPQTFQAHDAPQYIPAKITILVVAALAGVAALALRLLLGFWNKKRDQVDDGHALAVDELMSLDLTDRENKHFRYTYLSFKTEQYRESSLNCGDNMCGSM